MPRGKSGTPKCRYRQAETRARESDDMARLRNRQLSHSTGLSMWTSVTVCTRRACGCRSGLWRFDAGCHDAADAADNTAMTELSVAPTTDPKLAKSRTTKPTPSESLGPNDATSVDTTPLTQVLLFAHTGAAAAVV